MPVSWGRKSWLAWARDFLTVFSQPVRLSFNIVIFSLVTSSAGLVSHLLWLFCLVKWHLILETRDRWSQTVTFFKSGLSLDAVLLKSCGNRCQTFLATGFGDLEFLSTVNNCIEGIYQSMRRLHSGELGAAAQRYSCWKQVVTTASTKKSAATGSLVNNSGTKQDANRFVRHVARTG